MTSQSYFRAAVLDAGLPPPEGLTGPHGMPLGNRFNVYRNNVVMSLTEALQSSFPVVQKLVGEEFFSALAGLYLRQHPPSSPLLMFYGDAMPAFLTNFPPAQGLGYLPDMARLELALRQSYHAADAAPVAATALAEIAPDLLAHARLHFTPATRLVRSRWPIHAIWRFNMATDAPKPTMEAQDVLILRPEFDPVPQLLPTGTGDTLAALFEGVPLGPAIEALPDPAALGPLLTLLLQGCAVHSISVEAP